MIGLHSSMSAFLVILGSAEKKLVEGLFLAADCIAQIDQSIPLLRLPWFQRESDGVAVGSLKSQRETHAARGTGLLVSHQLWS